MLTGLCHCVIKHMTLFYLFFGQISDLACRKLIPSVLNNPKNKNKNIK